VFLKKLFKYIHLYGLIIIPFLPPVEPQSTVTLFNQDYQIVKYEDKLLVALGENGRIETQRYPIIFHAAYAQLFPHAHIALLNHLVRYRAILEDSVQNPYTHVFQNVIELMEDTSVIGKAALWQAVEQLSERYNEALLIPLTPERDIFFGEINRLITQKNGISDNFPLFLSTYTELLLNQTMEEFALAFRLIDEEFPLFTRRSELLRFYNLFQRIQQRNLPLSELSDELVEIRQKIQPFYFNLLNFQHRYYQNRLGWYRLTKNFFFYQCPFLTQPFELRSLVESYHYADFIKTSIIIKKYLDATIIQFSLVILLLIWALLIGILFFRHSVKKRWMQIVMAGWGFLAIFIMAHIAWFHFTTRSLLNEEKNSFQWREKIEQQLKFQSSWRDSTFISPTHILDSINQLNLLVLGKGGETHRDKKTGRTLGTELTDVIMAIQIDFNQHHINFISIPRDLLYQEQKINTLYHRLGPRKTQQIIRKITDIPLSNYAVFDFEIFKDIIDLIDGLTINNSHDINDNQWFQLPMGTYHLNGQQCLKYVRSRRNSSDFARAYRQQQVMMELLKKVQNPQELKKLLYKKFYSLALLYQKVETDLDMNILTSLLQKDFTQFTFRQIVLSSQNCLIPNEDFITGYYLKPKDDTWESIQRYIRFKIHYNN